MTKAPDCQAIGGLSITDGTSGNLSKAGPLTPDPWSLIPFVSGGGESRTPVLHSFIHSVYVRIPSIDVSAGWPMRRRPSDESPLISRPGRRRTVPLSRFCDTREDAPGGLRLGHPLDVTRSYAARAKLSLAIKIFPRVLPGTRGPGHAATESTAQSKPERPRVQQTKSSLKRPAGQWPRVLAVLYTTSINDSLPSC